MRHAWYEFGCKQLRGCNYLDFKFTVSIVQFQIEFCWECFKLFHLIQGNLLFKVNMESKVFKIWNIAWKNKIFISKRNDILRLSSFRSTSCNGGFDEAKNINLMQILIISTWFLIQIKNFHLQSERKNSYIFASLKPYTHVWNQRFEPKQNIIGTSVGIAGERSWTKYAPKRFFSDVVAVAYYVCCVIFCQ